MDDMRMHNQWATRPADERYKDLASMYAMLRATSLQCGVATVSTADLQVVPINHGREGLAIQNTRSGNAAELTNWSMNQLAAIAHAPATYLRTLTPEIAAECLNYSLEKQPRDSHQLYIRKEPARTMTLDDGRANSVGIIEAYPAELTVRAITSPGYTRIHTANIVNRLIELQANYPSWRAPEVYPAGDFGGTKEPCVGFAGDRDAYICLIDQENKITDPTDRSGDGLSRGIMVLNSEVGAKRLDVIMFLCERICGNYIIWGFKQIAGISMRHFGDKIRREWSSGIGNAFVDYTRLSAREEEDKIQHAAQHQIAGTKDDVIEAVWKLAGISKTTVTDAYELAEQYGKNPRTAWGMVHGLTRASQVSKHMDTRIDLDRAAATLMDF